jgi:hypothetical protein
MSIGGHSSIVWKNQGNRYTIQTSAYANLLGKMLDTTSSGHRDAYFLLPERFKEKRRRKEETQTNFDYARNTLTLSEKQKTLPLEKGLQDRASVVWQLVSMARAAPERFRAGNSLRIPVINRSRIDTWEIRVVGSETLVTPLGNLETIHLEKRAAKGKNVEIWLTPDHDWYPAQLIITDEKDNYRLEQVIRKITPVTTP